jgi:signal transduction histidine kinase
LMSNAIKYSRDNANLNIIISQIEGKISCKIIDFGIGIPSEDLDKIFNQFYRSKPNDHSEIKGMGLGLSIVKRLCTLLRISLHISSQENSGTTVILSF